MTDAFKCCDQFVEMFDANQIERCDYGSSWNVHGCCGGGCYVLTEIKFCPFCGARLPVTLNGHVHGHA